MYHKQGAEESIVLFLCQKKQENDKSQRSFQAPRCSLKSIQPLLLKIKVSSAIMHGDARFDCADLLLSFDLLIRIRKFSDFYKKKKKIRFRGRVLLKRDLGAQKKLDLKTESRVSLCMYKGALICGLFCRQAKLNLY